MKEFGYFSVQKMCLINHNEKGAVIVPGPFNWIAEWPHNQNIERTVLQSFPLGQVPMTWQFVSDSQDARESKIQQFVKQNKHKKLWIIRVRGFLHRWHLSDFLHRDFLIVFLWIHCNISAHLMSTIHCKFFSANSNQTLTNIKITTWLESRHRVPRTLSILTAYQMKFLYYIWQVHINEYTGTSVVACVVSTLVKMCATK